MFFKMKPVLVILAIIAGVGNAGRASHQSDDFECPSKCMCISNSVKCMFQKLTRIPDVPLTTKVL